MFLYTMAQNIPRGTPGRVLVILALLMGVVVVSAWRDALQREAATWIRHPTALGDPGLLVRGQPPVQLTTGGKTITLTAGNVPFHRRDDRMFLVTTGFGESLPFSVFSTRETLETEAEPKLHARTGPHQFLRLRAELAAPRAPVQPLPGGAREAADMPVRKAIPLEEEGPVFPDKNPENGAL